MSIDRNAAVNSKAFEGALELINQPTSTEGKKNSDKVGVEVLFFDFAQAGRDLLRLKGPQSGSVGRNQAAKEWFAKTKPENLNWYADSGGAGGRGARQIYGARVGVPFYKKMPGWKNWTYAQQANYVAHLKVTNAIKYRSSFHAYKAAEWILENKHIDWGKTAKYIQRLAQANVISLRHLVSRLFAGRFGSKRIAYRNLCLGFMKASSPSMSSVFGKYSGINFLPKVASVLAREIKDPAVRRVALTDLLKAIPSKRSFNKLFATLVGVPHNELAKAVVSSGTLQARVSNELSFTTLKELFKTILTLPFPRWELGVALRNMIQNMSRYQKNAIIYYLRRSGGLKGFVATQLTLNRNMFNAVILKGLYARNAAAIREALKFQANIVSKNDPSVRNPQFIGRALTKLYSYMKAKNKSYVVSGNVKVSIKGIVELGASMGYSWGSSNSTTRGNNSTFQPGEFEKYVRAVRNYENWKGYLDLAHRVTQWAKTQGWRFRRVFSRY